MIAGTRDSDVTKPTLLAQIRRLVNRTSADAARARLPSRPRILSDIRAPSRRERTSSPRSRHPFLVILFFFLRLKHHAIQKLLTREPAHLPSPQRLGSVTSGPQFREELHLPHECTNSSTFSHFFRTEPDRLSLLQPLFELPFDPKSRAPRLQAPPIPSEAPRVPLSRPKSPRETDPPSPPREGQLRSLESKH